MGSALRISLVLRLYFTVYPSSRHNTNTILWLPSLHHHSGRDDIKYSMEVTGAFREPLDRQLTKKINIPKFNGSILMNPKNELGGAVVEREKYKYRRWGPGVK